MARRLPRTGTALILPLPLLESQVHDVFLSGGTFPDDVHGPIPLSPMEREVIDTPEFQRLFRLAQLGLVDLLFQTANHTRGAHSIGTCASASLLVDKLNENARRFRLKVPQITAAEKVLIRLAALLHDIPHGPFSHDIERKTHHVLRLSPEDRGPDRVKMKSAYGAYDKHDDFANNAALYVVLLDFNRSVLARVLRHYSPFFWELLSRTTASHVAPFVDHLQRLDRDRIWPDLKTELLPGLLFHLLAFEDPDSPKDTVEVARSFDEGATSWGLGPREHWSTTHTAWYQPFRHDIIGNTLSADLIDYLQRDLLHLGLDKNLDLKLLDSYILVPWLRTTSAMGELRVMAPPEREARSYRCAIDLSDRKRGTLHTERINGVFRLLDLRHEIHEKAVFHRLVQAAIAMLARSLLVLVDKPRAEDLYWPGESASSPAVLGDEHFMNEVTARSRNEEVASPAHLLPVKLAERRIYRPLLILPGDRVPALLGLPYQRYADTNQESREIILRAFAAVVDSPRFKDFFLLVSWCIEGLLKHAFPDVKTTNRFLRKLDADYNRLKAFQNSVLPSRVIFWSLPYKQLYKDPALLVYIPSAGALTIEQLAKTIPEHSEHASLGERIRSGVMNAEAKYASLWTLYIFVSDGLFSSGILARIQADHPCKSDPRAHQEHLREAQLFALAALKAAWRFFIERDGADRNLLGADMSFTDLGRLIAVFLNEQDWFRDTPAARVIIPPVELYAHGTVLDRCRDIRYKHDLPASPPPENDSAAAHATELLGMYGCTWEALSREEAAEFLAMVRKALAAGIDLENPPEARLAALGGAEKAPPATLRRIFLGVPEWDSQ